MAYGLQPGLAMVELLVSKIVPFLFLILASVVGFSSASAYYTCEHELQLRDSANRLYLEAAGKVAESQKQLGSLNGERPGLQSQLAENLKKVNSLKPEVDILSRLLKLQKSYVDRFVGLKAAVGQALYLTENLLKANNTELGLAELELLITSEIVNGEPSLREVLGQYLELARVEGKVSKELNAELKSQLSEIEETLTSALLDKIENQDTSSVVADGKARLWTKAAELANAEAMVKELESNLVQNQSKTVEHQALLAEWRPLHVQRAADYVKKKDRAEDCIGGMAFERQRRIHGNIMF